MSQCHWTGDTVCVCDTVDDGPRGAMMSSAGMPDWLEPMAATLTQERFTGPD
jgi:hypothetical protein